jgi:hypothetical protein
MALPLVPVILAGVAALVALGGKSTTSNDGETTSSGTDSIYGPKGFHPDRTQNVADTYKAVKGALDTINKVIKEKPRKGGASQAADYGMSFLEADYTDVMGVVEGFGGGAGGDGGDGGTMGGSMGGGDDKASNDAAAAKGSNAGWT